MKVAVIGAGRNRNGIGRYIAKYFQGAGTTVTAVLGTSERTAGRAAEALRAYGITARAYTDFGRMAAGERPDIVVIASPAGTHRDYLAKCIGAGVHVLCEKPFFDPSNGDGEAELIKLFSAAEENKRIIAMNSQWSFALPLYERLCGPVDRCGAQKFFIRLSPLAAGKDMIPEAVPHALSLLYCGLGSGTISNLSVALEGAAASIAFRYTTDGGACEALIRLVRQEKQPREFSFGFNDRLVRREIDMASYGVSFRRDDAVVKAADPLQLSVQDFVAAAGEGREPRVGKAHIAHNMLLLNLIYREAEQPDAQR